MFPAGLENGPTLYIPSAQLAIAFFCGPSNEGPRGEIYTFIGSG